MGMCRLPATAQIWTSNASRTSSSNAPAWNWAAAVVTSISSGVSMEGRGTWEGDGKKQLSGVAAGVPACQFGAHRHRGLWLQLYNVGAPRDGARARQRG